MKTPKHSTTSAPGRPSRIHFTTLAAALTMTAATALGQSFWSGGTSDFNNAGFWSGTYIGGSNPNCANDSGSNNVVLIQPGDPLWQHGDTLAGQTAGSSGAYLQTGSTNNTGGGNWMRLGIGTGGTVGYYTLSNGVVNVGGQTHLGENGTGILTVAGGVYNTGVNNGNPGLCAGDGDFGVSTGTLILSGGTVNVPNNETWFGEGNGCTGYMVMTGGTINANNWFVFGRNGASGFGTMTAGTINFTGGGQFLIGGGGTGSLAQSGGILNVQNQYLIPQSGGPGHTGTNILSGTAVVNAHDWIAVGRNGGYGELDISGGASITRDNANDTGANFDVGAGGPGIVNQNGGAITNLGGMTWIGENSSATWNLNGGIASLGTVHISQLPSGSGTFNLNGGTLIATELTTGTNTAVSTLYLNGGTLSPSGSSTTFFHDLTLAFVESGGVVFDTQGYNVTASQQLQDLGGGVTKNGAGTILLTGANNYSGATVINNGTLGTTTATSGGGAYTIAGGAGLSVQAASFNGQLSVPGTAFGASSSLTIDLNTFGNPSLAPLGAGALTASGTVTLNVADALPQLGQFPLVSYSSQSGAANFVLGTLPVGVSAHLVNNIGNNSIDLDITQVNLPRWDGQAGGNWDINVTTNWVNIGTGTPTFYSDGNAVVFDDNAAGTTNVNLVATVSPGSLTINNSVLAYNLAGSGKISGSIGLLKEGASSFAILNTTGNTYTGPTTIAGGTLIVSNLANGGSPSSIGSSSASPTNLVIASGTLSYVGPTVSINRGYSLQGTNSSIDTESNLTLTGVTTATSASDFVKSGPAQLTYAEAGSNVLSGSSSIGYRVIAGTVAFSGPAGGQTNYETGHFGVGGLGGTNASVIITNATVNLLNGGLDVGRSGGATGTLTVQNGGVLAVTGGDAALGDGGGANSTGVLNQTGGSVSLTGQLFVGQNNNGVGLFNLSGGTFAINNWLAVGRQGGTGTLNLSGSGVLLKNSGGNLDIGTSAGIGGFTGTGVLNQTGGFITNTSSQTWLGEGSSGQSANGTWNMSAGSAVLGELHIGQGGTGTNTLNLSGTGTIDSSGYLDVALDQTIGNINIGSVSQPGGSLTEENDSVIGDTGTSTLNMVTNGGGLFTCKGTLYLSRNSATAFGTVNLNAGSTMVLAYLNNGWGFSQHITNNPQAFNFNGGTLRAFVGSPYFIQPYVNAVVQSGGAIIDDGGFGVSVLAGLVDGGGGGLTKQGNGILYMDGNSTYTGATIVTAGALGGTGSIAGPVTVQSTGKLAPGEGGIGTLTINNSLTLNSGSTTLMKLTLDGGATNDVVTGLTSISYAGSLVVSNVGVTSLSAGGSFKLFNAASASGNFSSITVLPSGSGSFNPATGILTITAIPTIIPPYSVGNQMIFQGTGSPGSTYAILTTTNVTTRLTNWTTAVTGTISGTGTYSNAVTINHSEPQRYFRLRTP